MVRMAPLLAGVLVAALLQSAPLAAQADEPRLTVATVEPDPGKLGYRVVVGERVSRSSLEVLDALSAPRGSRLAVLLDDQTPVGAIPAIASMASKACCFGDDLRFFVLDKDRKGMLELGSGREWIPYANTPEALSSQFP